MMRMWLGLLLAMIVATTSVSAAVMHAEMQGSTEIVICADIGAGGIISIRLDATGKPISQHHNCPDCIAGLATALMPAVLTWPVPQSRGQRLFWLVASAGHGLAAPAAIARGPPAFV